MEDMFDFQNMDVSTELASLQFGIDFDEVNILEGLHTPSPSHSLHFGSLGPDMPNEEKEQHGGPEVESSLTESGDSQNQELGTAAAAASSSAASPTKNLVEELAEAPAGNCEDQVSGPSSGVSDKASGVAISQVPVDPLGIVNAPTQQPPLLVNVSATQLNPHHLFSLPLDALVSQGRGSSTQAQQLNHPNPLSSQDEDIHMVQGTGLPNGKITNSQMPPVQHVVANNAFSGINRQPYPSYPSLLQQNPSDVGAGVGTQGQFLCHQRPPTMWNSTCGPHQQFPGATNVYDSHYAQNCVHYHASTTPMPHRQQFSIMPPQGSLSGMQKIFDVQSCMQPNCAAHPRPEAYSNYHQPAFAPMPPNPHDHQHVYRPMPPEPPVPTGPANAMYPDYPPLPRPCAMTYDSFGVASSMPPRYAQLQLQDYQRNNYHSQTRMPNGFGQQGLGSAQLSGSPRVPNNRNEQNQLWSTSKVQGQSSTVRGPMTLSRLAGSNVQNSRFAEPSRHINITPDASLPGSSRISWTQKPTGISLHNVVPAATNTITAQLNKGKLVNPSSSSRQPISDGVRRILNLKPKPKAIPYARRTNAPLIQTRNFQDPDETWIKELEKELNRAWNQPDSLTNNQEASRGRRGHEIGESSSSFKRQKKDSEGKDETPPDSHEAPNSPENEGNADQDANASDPSAAREFVNTVYDTRFEKIGLPIDPHIRIFKTAEN